MTNFIRTTQSENIAERLFRF